MVVGVQPETAHTQIDIATSIVACWDDMLLG